MNTSEPPFSKRMMRRAVTALLLAGVVAQGSAQSIRLPDIADSSEAVISKVDDTQLGELFLREIRAREEALEDPEVEHYVNEIGYRLTQASDGANRPFTFLVLREPIVNAFAGPNGVIGLNTGLILATESESELAAVLSHEIAHVTQRHVARAFELEEINSVYKVAGILAAIVLATQNSQAGTGALGVVTAADIQQRIDFIRRNEREADRIGMEILTKADYDPQAMPAFFEQLQQAQRYYRTPPEFLSTHPVTSDRIAEARQRAERFKFRQYKDSDAYLRVRAKLKVLVDGPKAAKEYFERRLASGQGRRLASAEHYGLVHALIGLEQWQKALDTVQPLMEKSPDVLPIRDALAKVLHGFGRTDEAVALYRQSLRAYVNDRLLVIGLAEVLIDAGRNREAASLLGNYVQRVRSDARAYHLLAEANARSGQRAASAAALAEHHYLNGRLEAAVYQLERAQRGDGGADYYLAARIGARLEQLKAEKLARDE
ncbi:MAG: M48 family metalloprotease [Gammaproteobacteria bacterium]|nr:M48 family metalloprotease [Gammaproteobacteria bacterium]